MIFNSLIFAVLKAGYAHFGSSEILTILMFSGFYLIGGI